MVSGRLVSLRPVERRHLDRMRAWANDPELAALLDRVRPVSDVEHEEWFARLHQHADQVYFAVETNADGQHIGNVWLCDINWRHRRAEVRIVIGDSARAGQGFGTEALSLTCQYAFEKLNLHKVYAYVLAANLRARRAFEKAGFELEGTLKADRWAGDCYTDVFLLARLNEAASGTD